MDTSSHSDLIVRLNNLSTTNVSDALDKLGLKGGIIGILPSWNCDKIVGRAVTVKITAAGLTPAKHHLGTEAINAAVSGDVIVVDNGGRRDVSCWGGILATAAHVKGIAGVIVDGACRDDVGGFPARDVEMAKKLLAEAGHADGLNLNLMIQPGEFSKDREICEAIIAQLAEAGVTVKYEEVESGVFQERQKSGDWDMYPNAIYNWVGDTPYYVSVFKTNGYVSSVDDILVKSNAAEGAEQSKLIQQAMQMVWDDAYQLWAVGRVSTWAWVKNLQDAAYLPNNWLLFSKAQLAG